MRRKIISKIFDYHAASDADELLDIMNVVRSANSNNELMKHDVVFSKGVRNNFLNLIIVFVLYKK